ncbi:MAG: phosphotransferase [Myxococcales bacterium]|nr:phosphotransferase [Myxococcales bacterium]
MPVLERLFGRGSGFQRIVLAFGASMDFDRKFDHHNPDFDVPLETVQAALPDLAIRAMTRLSGGYCNANYALELASGERCVLRIAGREPELVAIECALLRMLHGRLPVAEVLRVETGEGPIGRPHALLSLLPGEPLCRVEDTLELSAIAALGRQVGELAARLHDTRFEASGFFSVDADGELALPDPLPTIRGPYDDLARACLAKPVVRERLGASLFDALATCIERDGDVAWDGLPQGRLTHSDFNQKNILVAPVDGRWTVTGVLDFEFAHSGSGIDDLGNFVRFAGEQPDYGEALVEGYRAAGGQLPDDWRFRTRYLDLIPMMQGLARETIGPRSLATARAVIAESVRALHPAA